MTPKSPSTRLPLVFPFVVSEKNTEKLDRIESAPGSKIDVGLKCPVRVASSGCGCVPPIGIAVPLKDSPSGLREKYPEPGAKVAVLPPTKSTTRLRLDRFTSVRIGKSGGAAFGPVKFTMSNWPALPGKLTSHMMYPTATVPAAALVAHSAASVRKNTNRRNVSCTYPSSIGCLIGGTLR